MVRAPSINSKGGMSKNTQFTDEFLRHSYQAGAKKQVGGDFVPVLCVQPVIIPKKGTRSGIADMKEKGVPLRIKRQ